MKFIKTGSLNQYHIETSRGDILGYLIRDADDKNIWFFKPESKHIIFFPDDLKKIIVAIERLNEERNPNNE